jgi:hypothetical protein
VEDIDSKFLKQHYPDNDGNLFKGDPSGDLKYYGATDASYYSHYELHTNETENNWSDLVHLSDVINNTSASAFYDSLENVLDTWSFIYYMAATNIFANLDSYIGSGHNYYIYDDSTYLRFRWIAWDVNESFGNFQMSFNSSTIQTMNYDYVSSTTTRPLATKMLADPTYHAMYISAFCNLMPYFNNTVLDPVIDSLANVIRTSVYSDNLKSSTNQQFEDNITMTVNNSPGIKSFISARVTSLNSQLASYGCWLNVEEQATATNSFTLFPNPAQNSVTITTAENADDAMLSLRDVTGKEIGGTVFTRNGENQFLLSTGGLADGVYFVTLSSGNKLFTSKLVVAR